LGCFLARQYRDTRLTLLEKRGLFCHNFSCGRLAALDFSANRKTQANGNINKKAGLEAGPAQFAVEPAQ
jgi:hypothetical protein